jgi:two-component system, NtrC family, response regulator AtoC
LENDAKRAGHRDCSVLLASQDTQAARTLAETLRRAHIGFVQANTTNQALAALADSEFDVVITSEADALDDEKLARALRELCPDVPVLALSPAGQAVPPSLRPGVFDLIVQSSDEGRTIDTIRRALASSRLASAAPPKAALPALNQVPVHSAAMRGVISSLERVAPGNTTVMIRGESGTGKEVVARRLHELSRRARGPLIKVHCAGLPEQLLESELFGYERGAFTGAHARKPGRVELAERGTLFLDEIGEISAAVQVKLLRLLQDREYERLGGTCTLVADVRFVVATHRNLELMVQTGAFREDLYYRLNVVRLDLPPLRHRREDIQPLARHFCGEVARETGREICLSPGALARIGRADWRGNVRELRNVIERLVVMADAETISEQDVQLEQERGLGLVGGGEARAESSVISLEVALQRAERHALEKALRKASGNRALAARILGVSRRALFYKLREHGITSTVSSDGARVSGLEAPASTNSPNGSP